MGEVVNLNERRLVGLARKYAEVYMTEGPRFAAYFARVNIRARDRELLEPFIVKEITRLKNERENQNLSSS